MKNRLRVIVIVIINILFFNISLFATNIDDSNNEENVIEAQGEERLDLDIEEAKNHQKAYISFTDLHGIPLFTKEHEELKASLEKDSSYITSNIFVKESIVKKDNSVKDELFVNAQYLQSKEYSTSVLSNYDIFLYGIITLGLLICFTGSYYYFNYYKKRKEVTNYGTYINNN